MPIQFSSKYKSFKNEILDSLEQFHLRGETIKEGRNTIKIIEIRNEKFNIKFFKIPNLINKFAYRFLRKSKARRSFEYAQKLEEKGIGTPKPVAYFEEERAFTFGRSFYVSEQLDADMTFRELRVENEEILRAFTRFTYQLHENEVEFLDHSPGNTLIRKEAGKYRFYLVDLNRMNFKKLSFDERMKNFSRLTPDKKMVEIMADEYSRLIGRPKTEVFDKMWEYTREFQERFHRKKRIKKKLKFWKKA